MTRNPMLAKVHIAKKELGLDDATYRAVLARVTGKTSAGDCSEAQLRAVLDHFKSEGFKARSKAPKRAGSRPLAASPHAGKIRALWLALYNLGVIEHASEAALASFVERQTKVAALQWLTPAQAYKVIEALKSWSTRAAGVDWSPVIRTIWVNGGALRDEVDRPRQRVIEAQWQRLVDLGAVRIGSPPARDAWVKACVKSPCQIGLGNLTDAQADTVIEALGRKIRATLAKAAAQKEA
jgi:hypothetical protein